MKTIEIVTLKAAYDVLAFPRPKYVNLRELQTMCLPQKNTHAKQGWTFIGDWRKVRPYFHAA